MSSIYKKGRDGYYYYQTYTYNHKTGRRDKKIYHSLGTKDESEARAKQNNLDSKYSKKSKTSFLKILSTNNNKVRLKALLIFFSMVFPISLAFLLRTKPQKITIEAEENTFKIISKINVPTKIKEKKDLPIDYIFKEDVIKKDSSEKKAAKIGYSIPDYNIVRIDKFPGIFELCKIYVTIKNNNSNLEFLCKEIKSEYAQFPNLIICIYNDTEMGKNLAVGNVEFSGSSEQAEAWLAMYSYNSVEGEFYNNMPGAYIGINNQGKYK